MDLGEIWKLHPNGQHEYREFSTDLLFPSSRWLDWEDAYKPKADDLYLETLRSMAGLYGYAAEDVDTMIDEGILPEEIEAYFYQMELEADHEPLDDSFQIICVRFSTNIELIRYV